MSGDPFAQAVEAALVEATFSHAVEQWLEDRPYTRFGVPGLFLTAGQWEAWDEWQAHADRMDARYNAVRERWNLQEAFAGRGALNSVREMGI